VLPTPIHIGSRFISTDAPTFVIAELSANHGGSLETALEIIDVAADAGASAVKLQHYRPETITVRSDLPEFRASSGSLWDGRQLYDLYEEAMTPWEWTGPLIERAQSRGLEWFSSPFDETAVEFLESFNPPAYKIASFELVDLPLIRLVASTGRPMVMSTGMASIDEIDAAVATARRAGCEALVLLRCNSGYPATPAEMDLAAIPVMRERFGCHIGLSDHTLDNTAAIVATGLGAIAIEKHLTLSRAAGGPDADFSLEPTELSELVRSVDQARQALGSPRFGPSERERSSIVFRRSLRAARAISRGERVDADNVRSFRPAGGMPPERLTSILGKRVIRDLVAGEAITDDVLG
jgi:pseudaminic acid synthase